MHDFLSKAPAATTRGGTNIATATSLLSENVLGEVPRQLLDFMRANRITPGNKRGAAAAAAGSK